MIERFVLKVGEYGENHYNGELKYFDRNLGKSACYLMAQVEREDPQ